RHIAEQGYGREAALLDLAEWLLDVSSRPEAFSLAASLVLGSYRGTVKSLEDGEVESSTCFNVMCKRAVADGIDTFLVVGEFGLANGVVWPQTIGFHPPRFIRSTAQRSRETVETTLT